jgi:O-antigen/teichoic acid export membrane protein
MLFASGVSLTAITFVLDQALIGLLRGELQFWHNTLFAVAKLAALFAANLWLSHTVGLTIYTTWAVGNALSLASLAGFAVLKRGGFRSTPWPEWGLLRKLGPPALQHHLLALTLQVPTLALPVLVTILFSATTNAWFYVSWMVAGFLFVVPTTITTALYAVVSGKPTALVHKTWLALSLALVASMLAACISLFGAKQVLSLFGHVYVEQAASSLRILSLGSFPMMIKHHYGAVCRIQDRMAHATLLIIAGGLLELGLAALGACLGGLPGLSLGWVAGIYVEAVFMLRTIHQGAIYQGTALFAVRQPTHRLSALKRGRKSTL